MEYLLYFVKPEEWDARLRKSHPDPEERAYYQNTLDRVFKRRQDMEWVLDHVKPEELNNMANASDIEYALMAGNVYQASRHKNNWVPVPNGWKEIEKAYDVSTKTSFEATAYQRINSTDIVIS